MGLDQYAYAVRWQPAGKVDFPHDNLPEEFCYWRKHWPLHQWMGKRYLKNGGKFNHFSNCLIWLDKKDLLNLRRVLYRDGFGGSEWGTDVYDMNFVKKALSLQRQGFNILYCGDW